MAFRAFVPVGVSMIDWQLAGRAAPTWHAAAALSITSLGAASYIISDDNFKTGGGWYEYRYAIVYFLCLCVEISIMKHTTKIAFQSKWGPVLYTNGLSILPMFAWGVINGELSQLRDVRSPKAVPLVLLTCVVGTAMSYVVFRAMAIFSATRCDRASNPPWVHQSTHGLPIVARSMAVFGVANKAITVFCNYVLLPNNHASHFGIGATLVCLSGAAFYRESPLVKDLPGGVESRSASTRVRALVPAISLVLVLGIAQATPKADASLGASLDAPFMWPQSRVHFADGMEEQLRLCVHKVVGSYDTADDAPLAPHVFGGRRQVDIRDAFGRILYCETQMPRLNNFLDLFLFSGSGTTWTIAQGLQKKAESAPIERARAAKQRFSVAAWEGSKERFQMASDNLASRFPAVYKHLRNKFTLQLKEGPCKHADPHNSGLCTDAVHERPLRGDLLDFCRSGGPLGLSHVDVSVHDGDVAHGETDYDEWSVIKKHCKPTMVNVFNSNIHPAHQKMVQELDSDASWKLLAHGWVPYARHYRYKNRTFHVYVHVKRYETRVLPRSPAASRDA